MLDRFQWVSLQLQYLRGMKLEKAVRDQLGRLPTDLRKIYHETLNQRLNSYEEVEKTITENALRLLLCLQETLTTNDFVLALTRTTGKKVKINPDNILDLCSGFVVFDDMLDVFCFVHLSVQEFLESRHGYTVDRKWTTKVRKTIPSNAYTASLLLKIPPHLSPS